MKKTNREIKVELTHYADWLAGDPNLQMWDGEAVLVSRTNSHVVYKAWNMSTGERSV